jgi:shikimate kinase
MNNKNIVLIGMPNSGKSSSGRDISRKLQLEFFDTDIIITKYVKKKPIDIVKQRGLNAFLKLQEEIVLGISIQNVVISTGGAVIYSQKAMEHLKNTGVVFFLDQDVEILKSRINRERRFASSKTKSFEELYNERMPLYKHFADHVIDCRNKKIEEVADEIIKIFKI